MNNKNNKTSTLAKSTDKRVDNNKKHSKLRTNTKNSTKFRSKRQDVDDASMTDASSFPHTNDPRWRLQNPVLSSNVANILFSDPLGIKYDNQFGVTESVYKAKWSASGIMVLDTLPLWGEATSATSPVNVAGQKIKWLANVKWYSQNDYSSADVMAMVMAVDAIHIKIYEAMRIYALASKYSVENKYWGKNIIEALGWDYNSVTSNLADFRYCINQAIAKINQLHIPNVFYCVDSHRNMYTRIFTESPINSPKSQIYIFRSRAWWRWNDSTGVLYAVPADDDKEKMTPETFEQHINVMLDPVLSSEFIAKMDADLLRIFTYDQCFQLPMIGDVLDIEFAYDPLVLCQIYNAEFVNARLDYYSNIDSKNSTGQSAAYSLVNSLNGGQSAPSLYAYYMTHLDSRTDLMSGAIMLKFKPKSGITSRTDTEQLLAKSALPWNTIGDGAFHYFNILSILPKDPGTILEAAHFKFNLMQTSVAKGDLSANDEFKVVDFQDALIYGIHLYQGVDDQIITGNKTGVLPNLSCLQRRYPLSLREVFQSHHRY